LNFSSRYEMMKWKLSGFCTLQVYQGLELDSIELDLSSFTHT
jgi:hypothetical protein